MAEDVFSRDFRGEEYGLGKCFNKKNYDPNFKGPTWDELLTLLADVEAHTFAILFCGRAGSDGQVGSTGWGITQRPDVQHALLQYWDVNGGKLKELSASRNLTPLYAATLLKLNVQPVHITGIFIRKID